MIRTLSSFVGLIYGSVLVCQLSLVAEDKLVIMSPHWEGIEREFDRSFKAWYKSNTGDDIQLDWIDQGGSSSDFRFIEAEFKRVPKGIGIDLFFGGGTDNYMKLAEMGLLHSFKLPEEELNRIPKDIYGIPVYDSQYRWYGTALSSFGIMHNEFLRQRLKLPEVKTWQDLAQPELLGKIGAADPRESGSAHMIYEIILQGYGWQKGFALITQLGANVRSFSAGSNAIPKDVVKGQVIYGMAIDFYAYAQIAVVGKEKIKFVIPSDAAVVSPDSIAILVGAENLEAAKKFITFTLSDTAQKLWVLPNGDPEGPEWPGGLNRASVVPALYDKLGERCVVPNPFTRNLTPIKYDAEKGGIRWNIVSDLIGTLVIENHKNLVGVWKAINKTNDLQKRVAAIQILGEVPITEDEAMRLSETEWKEPDFRNRKLQEWGQFSREKFRRARKAAK